MGCRAITKRFGPFTALDAVDFDVRPGEIHALLGENGAGKSTLMNVLSGALAPDAGEIVMGHESVHWSGPQDAAYRGGIGMVHQHFQLVPVFTVAENLALGVQKNGFLLRLRDVERKAAAVADSLGWRITMHARAGHLPVGAQQRIEILKALLIDPRILFFDEPTAVLTPGESEELFGVMRALRDQGTGIVFVSHKLGEVMALCDRVTVLRHGRVVGAMTIGETDAADLARRMVGQEVGSAGQTILSGIGAPVLEVEGLSAKPVGRDDVALDRLTFSVAEGEILGVAGVDGNGQSELFEALVGVRPLSVKPGAAKSWPLRICGETITFVHTPRDMLQRGVAWIPPDRQREGLALGMSVESNVLLGAEGEASLRSGPFLNLAKMRRSAAQRIDEFDVRAPSIGIPAGSLSGGNQQKIVIARALAGIPKLLIASSPTRGLDVGAAAYVHHKLREAQQRGTGILLISTELEEIRLLAHRIAVMYEGRLMGIVSRDTSAERIGLLMGGKEIGAG